MLRLLLLVCNGNDLYGLGLVYSRDAARRVRHYTVMIIVHINARLL